MNAVEQSLRAFRSESYTYWPFKYPRNPIVGVNIGKNKDGNAIEDYTTGVRRVAKYADYLVINISSPNTPNLRALQRREQLRELMVAVLKERDALWNDKKLKKKVPVLIKIAPDLTREELQDIAEAAKAVKIDGIIVSNTTTSREGIHSYVGKETGGLSGQPLFCKYTLYC